MSRKFFTRIPKFCSAIGGILGFMTGFSGAGLGGALLGALVGLALGALGSGLITGAVEYLSPSADGEDYKGASRTLGTTVAIIAGIAFVVWLINALWGVGGR